MYNHCDETTQANVYLKNMEQKNNKQYYHIYPKEVDKQIKFYYVKYDAADIVGDVND